MKRWNGREDWLRAAGLVLVAVVASFSLSSGVLDVTASSVHPAKRESLQRAQAQVHPVLTRRPWSERQVHLPSSAVLLAALALLGLVVLGLAGRPAWSAVVV